MPQTLRKSGKCFANRAKQLRQNKLIVSPSPWKRDWEIGATPLKLAWRWRNWIAIPAEEGRRNNLAVRRSKRFVRTLTPMSRAWHKQCYPEPFFNKER